MMPDMTGTRYGVFEVLSDDCGKHWYRELTVRCTTCGTQATRLYRSLMVYRGKGCIHCPGVASRNAVLGLVRKHRWLSRSQIRKHMPNGTHRSEPWIRRIADSLVEDGLIGRQYEDGMWFYHPLDGSNSHT